MHSVMRHYCLDICGEIRIEQQQQQKRLSHSALIIWRLFLTGAI